MNFIVYNPEMDATYILDQFKSLIWTDRYSSYGDFELYTPVQLDILKAMSKDMYLWYSGSDRVMVIDRTELTSDPDEGVVLRVAGKSMEYILERRIIWNFTEFNGSFQDGIEKLLNENAIKPSNPDRKIKRLIFKKSTDKRILNLTVNYQFHGDNLYSAIERLCNEKHVGFRITLSDTDQFVFELYFGTDRSYDQVTNPYVIFSPNFDNLVTSNYINSVEDYRTVTLVAGVDEGSGRKLIEVPLKDGGKKDIFRREMFTESRINRSGSDGSLSDSDYTTLLKAEGLEDLSQHTELNSFDGQVDNLGMYTNGVDYNIGDIVQIENGYGMKTKSRVVEIVQSISDEGIEVYPTFESVNKT